MMEAPGEEEPMLLEKKEETYSIDQAIERLGFGKFHWRLLFLCGACGVIDAMEMMCLPFLQPASACTFHVDETTQALLSSVVFLGMMVGSLLWGFISDRYGRRQAYLASTMMTFVFGILSSAAPTFGALLVCRAFVGMGVTGSAVAFTLFAEFLARDQRGTMLVLIDLFGAIGVCLAVLIAWATLPHASLGWRGYLVFSSLPVAIQLFLYPFLPESIRYLVFSGQHDEAQELLNRISVINKKSLPDGMLERAPLQSVVRERGRISDLFTKERRRLSLLFMFIWFSDVFIYYGVVLLTTNIFNREAQAHAAIAPPLDDGHHHPACFIMRDHDFLNELITSFSEIPGVFIFIFLINWSRKGSQALGFFITAACLFVYMSYAHYEGMLEVSVFFVARIFISGTFQSTYTATPECMPTAIRSLAMGVFSAFARFGGMATPLVASTLSAYSMGMAVWVYVVMSLLGGTASLLLPLETAGKNLVEIGQGEEEEREKFSAADSIAL